MYTLDMTAFRRSVTAVCPDYNNITVMPSNLVLRRAVLAAPDTYIPPKDRIPLYDSSGARRLQGLQTGLISFIYQDI